jgi:DHA1 family bicyclomycin/chloramphenicol resistance-like MFS transporter
MIFAFLSVGLIGGSQLNIFLNRKFKSERIFFVALACQVTASLFFLVGVWGDLIGLYASIGMFFILLSCLGLINPNANALALAPFTNNIGSASALLGFTQIGVAAMASTGVGLLSADDTTPIVSLIAATASVALVILLVGKGRISQLDTATGGVGSSVSH